MDDGQYKPGYDSKLFKGVAHGFAVRANLVGSLFLWLTSMLTVRVVGSHSEGSEGRGVFCCGRMVEGTLRII